MPESTKKLLLKYLKELKDAVPVDAKKDVRPYLLKAKKMKLVGSAGKIIAAGRVGEMYVNSKSLMEYAVTSKEIKKLTQQLQHDLDLAPALKKSISPAQTFAINNRKPSKPEAKPTNAYKGRK